MAKQVTIEERLTGLVRDLSPAEVEQLTPERVARAVKAARKQHNEVSALRIELEESRRTVAETKVKLAEATKEEGRAKKSGQVAWIMEVQAEVQKLQRRLLSYKARVPSIQGQLKQLEAE